MSREQFEQLLKSHDFDYEMKEQLDILMKAKEILER